MRLLVWLSRALTSFVVLGTLWSGAETALCLFEAFAPSPEGTLGSLDAFDEIRAMERVLNVILPIVLVSFALELVCQWRRCEWRPAQIALATAAIVVTGLCSAAYFEMLNHLHGPETNLWQDHIWWYFH